LAAHPEAPSEQRLMSGMAAVDLYETKLNDLTLALQVLATLKQAKLSTLPVRERLARAAAKAERFEDAVALLEELMHERETREGRIEAARLAMTIHRDRLLDPVRGLSACRALLAEAPLDAEAIDWVLEENFSERDTRELLLAAKRALLEQVRSSLDAENVARLARIAGSLDELGLRQATLGALVTLGVNTEEMRRELHTLDQRAKHYPQMAISDAMVRTLAHPQDDGPVRQLMRVLHPVLNPILGPTLKSLDLGKKHRVKAQAGGVWSEIAPFTGAFGLGEVELYVGGRDPNAMVMLIDSDTWQFVVGENIKAPFGPLERQRAAKVSFCAARGCSMVLSHDSAEVAAMLVAACRVAEVPVEAPPYALTSEFERLLNKLPRRLKRELVEPARAIQSQGLNLRDWADAAQQSAERVAALAVGDVSIVVLSDEERLTQERNVDAHTEARRMELVKFVVSEKFLALRESLGLAVR
jgi:hypothetical protein